MGGIEVENLGHHGGRDGLMLGEGCGFDAGGIQSQRPPSPANRRYGTSCFTVTGLS
jgi:hypothetical protein